MSATAPAPAGTAAGTAPRRARRTRLPLGVLAALIVLAVLAAALLAPGLLGTGDPLDADPAAALQAPGGAHWFGTDQLGRDLYDRVVHGARYSVTIALLAVAFAMTAGSLLGLTAALAGRLADEAVGRLLDLLSAFPSMLMALLFAAFLGRGVVNLSLAVGIAAVPSFGRVIRRRAIAVRDSDFVVAAVTFGDSRASVLARHVLPNVVPSVLLLGAIEIGSSILTVSGIGFVGLGPERPAPEWGSLLSEGRAVLALAWWPTLFPGLAIAVTILAFTTVGRHLQRLFERRVQP